MLYYELKEVEDLPSCVSEAQKKEIIKNVISKYFKENQLMREVVNGNAAFEKSYSPLVEENERIRFFNKKGDACDTTKYMNLAEETKRKFHGLLPFDDYYNNSYIDICSTISFSRRVIMPWIQSVFMMFITLVVCGVVASYLDFEFFLKYFIIIITGIVAFGGFLSVFSLLAQMSAYKEYLVNRKGFVKKILSQAKYLDAIIKEVK